MYKISSVWHLRKTCGTYDQMTAYFCLSRSFIQPLSSVPKQLSFSRLPNHNTPLKHGKYSQRCGVRDYPKWLSVCCITSSQASPAYIYIYILKHDWKSSAIEVIKKKKQRKTEWKMGRSCEVRHKPTFPNFPLISLIVNQIQSPSMLALLAS